MSFNCNNAREKSSQTHRRAMRNATLLCQCSIFDTSIIVLSISINHTTYSSVPFSCSLSLAVSTHLIYIYYVYVELYTIFVRFFNWIVFMNELHCDESNEIFVKALIKSVYFFIFVFNCFEKNSFINVFYFASAHIIFGFRINNDFFALLVELACLKKFS